MSIAFVPSRVNTSATWRQFQLVCLLVLAVVAIGCGIYGVETGLLHSSHRFVENPTEVMVRAIGLAHFWVGWLFLFTSPSLRSRAACTRLAFCTLLGVGLCWIFAECGADKSPLMMLAFYGFFFVHEAMDEAKLYRNSGDMRDDGARADRFLPVLSGSVATLMIVMLAAFYLTRMQLGRSTFLHGVSGPWVAVFWCVLVVIAAIAMMLGVRSAQRNHGSAFEAVCAHRPLLSVYAGILSILAIGSLFGTIGANLIILVHVLTWLLHTQRKLGARRQTTPGIGSWLRQSPAGFVTLHLALTVLALTLFCLRTHLWERTGLVCDLMSKTWFPYWSIMHIAMAFWRTK